MATQYPASNYANYANYTPYTLPPQQQQYPSPPPPPPQYASVSPIDNTAGQPNYGGSYAPEIPVGVSSYSQQSQEIPAPTPRYIQKSDGSYVQQQQEIPAPVSYAPRYPQESNGSYVQQTPPEIPAYTPPVYSQESSYAPPPVDTSYSPRAPSLPASSFDYGSTAPSDYGSTAPPSTSPYNWTPAAPYYGTEYQFPSSTGSGNYSYTPSSYTPAYPEGYNNQWGYQQPAVPPELVDNVPSRNSYKTVSYAGEDGGIYAYDGGNSKPYGSTGTGSASWSNSGSSLSSLPKIAKALPKVETECKNGGLQRYHVKVLSDSGEPPQNVICQIGLDGVRLLEPKSNTILRIYPLETITKWEIPEPSVFAFWAKTSVDFEQRKTRLQSSSSTTNTILDTVTAACVQLCEMVGKDSAKAPTTSDTTSNTTADGQKKGFEWFKAKPAVEEIKEHWVPDEAVTKCSSCTSDFGAFLRRHHCRNCGLVFCDRCTKGRIALTTDEDAVPVRVCDGCLGEVTERTEKAKQNKFVSQHTHEDLAKKLQEELKRNAPRKTTSYSSDKTKTNDVKYDGQTSLLNCSNCTTIAMVPANDMRCPNCGTDPRNGVMKKSSRKGGRKTREVACPICTVHLEVEVPNSGSETVECGVCQHPFLVKA